MPVPYRKHPRAEGGCAAYLDVVRFQGTHLMLGALLLMDGRGQPLEFVHNALARPGGPLWPEGRSEALGLVALCQTLFEACRREPDLLLCLPSLGAPDALKDELAPSIPFAQVRGETPEEPPSWTWINDPPTRAMRAHALHQELVHRGFLAEPFERVRLGLRELYPDAPWSDGLSEAAG